ncbi:MAG TPA: transcription antiterminator LicT [Lachnospiraceae bacterium]|nr:transcription antiterminator LicT [Lachnospiraceae bacterium]
MIVHKVLNNNIVSSLDERGREVLLVGRGLGWQAKPGEAIDKKKIDKIFRMDTGASTEKLKQLFLEVDVEVIELSARIIDYARETLKKKLNKNVYITLTDHISFAIERMKQGITFRNALQWETSKLYPAEYAIGLYALELLQKTMQLEFPKDEAGSIALHIVNAEYDCNMNYTQQMTEIIQNSLNIVRYAFHMEFDEQSLDYQRFTTHLLFFAQRALDHKLMDGGPDEMYELMKKKNPRQFRCAEKIQDYLKKQYNFTLSAEEITFLTVHIVRVTTKL